MGAVLIEAGQAYVDDQSADGDPRAPRDAHRTRHGQPLARALCGGRSLDLFARMRAGELPDGSRVLRARIDMASPNINLRDPVLYRIVPRQPPAHGGRLVLYPTYDFAHGQSDAIEGVTHSICTLEFANHRPLYDWLIEHLPVPSRPHQYEFARLNLTWTVLSNDSCGASSRRAACVAGTTRACPPSRGCAAAASRPRPSAASPPRSGSASATRSSRSSSLSTWCATCSTLVLLAEFAVLRPLKVVIEDYPADQVGFLEAVNNPEDPGAGVRQVPFGRELWIERDDLMEESPPKFYRLAPGREVRLRYGYYVTFREVIRDAAGKVVELRCTHDPATRGGDAPDGRRPKATVPLALGRPCCTRRGPTLRTALRTTRSGRRRRPPGRPVPRLGGGPHRLLGGARIRQFRGRRGDPVRAPGLLLRRPDSRPDHLVFVRTLGLRDTWARIRSQERAGTR